MTEMRGEDEIPVKQNGVDGPNSVNHGVARTVFATPSDNGRHIYSLQVLYIIAPEN
jgi:hypothetical protein